MLNQQQMLLPLIPETLKTFQLFFPGKNQLIVETLKHPLPPQFIFLFGTEGSGKTHLLEAYAAQALQKNQRVLFLPLKNLNTATDYLKDLPELDAVLIDDLEHLPPALEADLFHLFNQLQAHNTSLIITSTSTPNALDIKLPDLKSRLESGLALRLEALKDEELKAALTLHAKHMGLKLNNKIYDFLLNHLERNLINLLTQLKKVADYSLQTRRPITLMMIKEVLAL